MRKLLAVVALGLIVLLIGMLLQITIGKGSLHQRFSEEERKQIFIEVLYAEDRAAKEAKKQGVTSNERLDELKSNIAESHDLTPDELEQIVMEGFQKNWSAAP